MQLSTAQKNVLEKMKSGLFIWTNEGANFSVWLEDETAKKKESLRKRTVEILIETKKIEFEDGDYKQGLFKYKLKK